MLMKCLNYGNLMLECVPSRLEGTKEWGVELIGAEPYYPELDKILLKFYYRIDILMVDIQTAFHLSKRKFAATNLPRPVVPLRPVVPPRPVIPALGINSPAAATNSDRPRMPAARPRLRSAARPTIATAAAATTSTTRPRMPVRAKAKRT